MCLLSRTRRTVDPRHTEEGSRPDQRGEGPAARLDSDTLFRPRIPALGEFELNAEVLAQNVLAKNGKVSIRDHWNGPESLFLPAPLSNS